MLSVPWCSMGSAAKSFVETTTKDNLKLVAESKTDWLAQSHQRVLEMVDQ